LEKVVPQESYSLAAFYWIVELGALVAAATLVIWAIGKSASQLPARDRLAVRLAVGLGLPLWFATVAFLAAHNVFRFSAARAPALGLAVALPLVVAVVSARLWPALREAVLRTPQQWLIGAHSFRVLGILFLLAMANGQLPALFALPAGVGDILVGVGALEIAYLYRHGVREARELAFVLNVFGIADMLNAVAIGFLAAATPFRLLFTHPSTNLMTVLPFVMVPVFGIPLYLMLHFASLSALRLEEGSRIRVGGTAALVEAVR
jgi:hypothetical protein